MRVLELHYGINCSVKYLTCSCHFRCWW